MTQARDAEVLDLLATLATRLSDSMSSEVRICGSVSTMVALPTILFFPKQSAAEEGFLLIFCDGVAPA